MLQKYYHENQKLIQESIDKVKAGNRPNHY